MSNATPVSIDRQNVRGPLGTAPLRRPNSARRTSTVDMTWPGGFGTQLRLDCRARDLVTFDPAAEPLVVATGAAKVGIGADRMIEDISVDPVREGAQRLVGCRGGGYLRAALDEMLPGERTAGTPLYLLLDDVSGTSLIAGFAWSRHTQDWLHQPQRGPRPDMENVCIGFATGSSALDEQREGQQSHRVQPVGSLVHPDDPHGWHELVELPNVSMRRARRIDVWEQGDQIMIDAMFQDTASDPEHGRVAIHEYALKATADRSTGLLTSISPDARVLPFMECPSAMASANAVVGVALQDLRAAVLERLSKHRGCTHLNDALRSLAEVPVLLAHLH
jgi:Protein of unknown function (DUF2889)